MSADEHERGVVFHFFLIPEYCAGFKIYNRNILLS